MTQLNHLHVCSGSYQGKWTYAELHIKWVLCASRYTITYPLEAGMVVSNEPGYYEDGEFGIRIENLLIVKEAETPFRFGEQPYLSFERLTMCPLQRKMIDLDVRALTLPRLLKCN